jgi:ribonuclease HI
MHDAHPHFLLFSCAESAGGRAGRWQFVLQSIDGTSRLAAGDVEPGAPSDRTELLAVVRGLEALEQPSRVTLVTPSRYVSRGIVRCLDQWRAAQWRWERFGRVEPIRDVDLWQRVDRAMGYHEVDCHAWPAPDAAGDAGPATAQPDGSCKAGRQASDERAVLIVRKSADRNGRTGVLVRWATACDGTLARLSGSVATFLRCLVPAPRST